MRQRGRPMDPRGQVQRLEGDELAKQRLKAVLATLRGERSIDDACAELGIGASRFFELKQEALRGAVEALTPRPAGRPPRAVAAATREQLLEARIRELEQELQCAYVRTELALALPRLKQRPEKKRKRHRREQRHEQRRSDARKRRGPRAPLAAPRGADHGHARPAR